MSTPARDESCGWRSDLPAFYGEKPRVVRLRLAEFVRDPGPEQIRAWDESIPWLQRECSEVVRCDDSARTYTAILEYELPRESRRPDVIVLENGVVVVLELKGKESPSSGDIDQVSAYRRDLLCYHAECADRPVHAVLVPTRAGGQPRRVDDVTVVGPAGVHALLLQCTLTGGGRPLTADEFLRHDAYQPLPSLVRAARDLFQHRPLPMIKRARAATDPAVESITGIARAAAGTATRHLVLVTGVPGAGKTLVGLRLVHAGFLDELAVPRKGVKPPAPAVFLSGNGPLVQVLQDALKDGGGDGKVFVRGVKDYVKHYTRKSDAVPPEHLLVFDEAQRAWDSGQVSRKHADGPGAADGKSEPEHFIEFAERIPGWCVVVGLIGSGQEIHAGEEGGVGQWRRAIEGSKDAPSWTVHAPIDLEALFRGGPFRTSCDPALNLTTEIRYHLAPRLHEFVAALIESGDAVAARQIAEELHGGGHRLWVTRSLARAKAYARDRYENSPEARYGILASSKDKILPGFGVDNSWQTTSRVSRKIGRWYNAPREDPLSCCRLDAVATEFSSQGLELDLAVLAWGADFARREGAWTIEKAGGTRHALDPFRLRQNVYRVLLTRGRDGTVVFVPPDPWLDETHRFLLDAGMRRMEDPSDAES